MSEEINLYSYVPTLVKDVYGETYGLFAFKVVDCPICGKLFFLGRAPFDIIRQMKNAGIGHASQFHVDKDGERFLICTECATAGKATFVCPICGETRASSTAVERFGNGDEGVSLCGECYASVPAKEWNEACKKYRAKYTDYDW